MKKILFVIGFVFLVTTNVYSQNNMYERTIKGYQKYVLKEYGIRCKQPKDSKDLNRYFSVFKTHYKFDVGYLYGPMFQTEDEKHLIMFPFKPSYLTPSDIRQNEIVNSINRILNLNRKEVNKENRPKYPRSHIVSEIKAAKGFIDENRHPIEAAGSFVFNEHVTTLHGHQITKTFNADTVYVYDLPLEKTYMERYNKCTGIVFCKKDRAEMIFKLLSNYDVSDEESLEILEKCVKYKKRWQFQESIN